MILFKMNLKVKYLLKHRFKMRNYEIEDVLNDLKNYGIDNH